ncbi:MAG: helix-turn-helix domain-containing protein [Pseudomonadota bacterium]
METRCDIVLVVYDGFELLDMSGPASVFNMADKVSGGGAYRITLVSTRGGGIACNSGIVVQTEACAGIRLTGRHTVLVMGADEAANSTAQADTGLLAFMKQAEGSAGRYGSVCTGAFIVAAAGLLNGRSVTTHWRDADGLKALYPEANVEVDRLYVRDDRLWSSAGISSGIDMALAIVEEDLGRAVMSRVAKRLVVYAHRPGTQAQFSSVLEAQSAVSDRFGDLLAWIDENLERSIGVPDMATVAGMSERSFYRNFTAAIGITPSRFLEQQRLARAKQLLEAGAPVKAVPSQVGFLSESGFRAAFEARFQISPSHFKAMHGGSHLRG